MNEWQQSQQSGGESKLLRIYIFCKLVYILPNDIEQCQLRKICCEVSFARLFKNVALASFGKEENIQQK